MKNTQNILNWQKNISTACTEMLVNLQDDLSEYWNNIATGKNLGDYAKAHISFINTLNKRGCEIFFSIYKK